MARRKPEPGLSIATLEAADAALAELAGIDRDLRLIDVSLEEDITALRKEAAEMAKPLLAKRELLEMALTAFATTGKARLFEKVKSRKLLHGIIGFRSSTELVTVKGFTWKRVLAALHDMAMSLEGWGVFGPCIRPKYEVDKDAVRKLPEESMALIGCELKEKDVFFYETPGEQVADRAA